jgi:hypothetical protein
MATETLFGVGMVWNGLARYSRTQSRQPCRRVRRRLAHGLKGNFRQADAIRVQEKEPAGKRDIF